MTRAIILAAGRGERMRPLTDHCPKPLLQVDGVPLIVYVIRALRAAGVQDLVINHAHLGTMLEQDLGNGERWDVNIRWSAEDRALETAGGIVKALPLLGDEPFIVVNGDVWSDFDFRALSHMDLAGRLGHLIMVNNPPHHPSGDFGLDDAGLIGTKSSASALTFSGISLLSPQLFADCKPGKQPLRPLLDAAMARGLISGEHYAGSWVDVGTPERLASLQSDRHEP